jgi:hypothetical protein
LAGLENDKHIGLIAAYLAFPGSLSFHPDFSGRFQNDPLAGDGHLRFIPALFAYADFNFIGHAISPWKTKINGSFAFD